MAMYIYQRRPPLAQRIVRYCNSDGRYVGLVLAGVEAVGLLIAALLLASPLFG